jgi:hypothetical protein
MRAWSCYPALTRHLPTTLPFAARSRGSSYERVMRGGGLLFESGATPMTTRKKTALTKQLVSAIQELDAERPGAMRLFSDFMKWHLATKEHTGRWPIITPKVQARLRAKVEKLPLAKAVAK